MQGFDLIPGKILWRQDKLCTPVFLGLHCGLAGKESACNAGELGSIPGLGRYPEGGKGYPLQYSGLENSMGCMVHGVTKSQTRLSDFHFSPETQGWHLLCDLGQGLGISFIKWNERARHDQKGPYQLQTATELEAIDISPGNLDSRLCFIQPGSR